MSASTGPILAAGAVVIGNAVIVQNHPWSDQADVAVGTAVVAVALAIAEHAIPNAAVMFSWLILASVLLVRVKPNVPSPLESFADWWNTPKPGTGRPTH
jgi:hypothetical protein